MHSGVGNFYSCTDNFEVPMRTTPTVVYQTFYNVTGEVSANPYEVFSHNVNFLGAIAMSVSQAYMGADYTASADL